MLKQWLDKKFLVVIIVMIVNCNMSSCILEKKNKVVLVVSDDTITTSVFNGVWIFEKQDNDSFTCKNIIMEFVGSQFSIREINDSIDYKGVIKIKNSKELYFLYLPLAINTDRYRLKYSESFLQKFFYLNSNNVNYARTNCLLSTTLIQLGNVKSYKIDLNKLIFITEDGMQITLKKY